MYIYLKSRMPFAFPGLWDCWVDRDTGSELTPSQSLPREGLGRRIHDRMPVIYDAASWDTKITGAGRFKVLSQFNDEAVLDKETGLCVGAVAEKSRPNLVPGT
jgi:hypothetical protein